MLVVFKPEMRLTKEKSVRAGALQIGICNSPPLTFGKILKRNKRLRNKR